MTCPRVIIRKRVHRRVNGYQVTLYRDKGDSGHYTPSVFVESRQAAERCRDKLLSSRDVTLDDMR
jgi:hypothetical protein